MWKFVVLGVCATIGFVSALWTWHTVTQSVIENGVSTWIVPGIAVSIMAIMLIMVMLLASQWWQVLVVAVLFFASALFFVQGVVVFIAILIAIGAALSMARAVQGSMRDHVRIRVFTHAHAGIGRLVTALALMISAVFYTMIIERDAATLMLSNTLHATITGPIARMVLPSPLAHGTGAHGEATVDDFIRQILSDNKASSEGGNMSLQFLENYAGAVSERLKGMMPLRTSVSDSSAVVSGMVLTQARTTLAQELGMSLTGSEPVADVFVQSLERQIQSFAERKILPAGYKFSKALAGVVAFFLFLSIGWIGSFIKIFWLWAVQGLFALFVRVGLVRITRVPTEQEQIA